jgi:hypothetical protein
VGKPAGRLEANITLNRKDFGLTWNVALETGGFLVGDEVRISLSIQAIAQWDACASSCRLRSVNAWSDCCGTDTSVPAA